MVYHILLSLNLIISLIFADMAPVLSNRLLNDVTKVPIRSNVKETIVQPVLLRFTYNDENAYLENTLILQNLINKTAIGNTLISPNPEGSSTLYIDKIKIDKNISIVGNNLVIKRAPILGHNMEPSKLKWHRMFDMTGTEASDIRISDLILDGSIHELTDIYNVKYKNYEIEQSALLFVSKKNAPNQSTINILLDNCHFINSGADGIHIYRNVNATITNSSATDCFRGGLTFTGANSSIDVDGFNTYADCIPTGIDVEIDGKSFDGRHTVQVSLKNMVLDSDFDIGVNDQSRVYVENINLLNPPLNLSFANSNAYFKNCTFVNDKIEYNNSHIRAYGNLTFDHCTFTAIESKSKGVSSVPIILDAGYKNQSIKFQHCTFNSNIENRENTKVIIGTPLEVSRLTNNNVKIFEDCSFGNNLSVGIQSFQGNCSNGRNGSGRGSKVSIKDVLFNSYYPLRIDGDDTYGFSVEIECSTFNSSHFAYLRPSGPKVKDTLKLDNVAIKQEANKIISPNLNALNSNLKILGKRIIIGNDNPNDINANGFIGDKYIFSNKVWECTTSGYYYGNIANVNDCTLVEKISKLQIKKPIWSLTKLSAENLVAGNNCFH